MAPPRVCAIRRCARSTSAAGSPAGSSSTAATASIAALAASGPWPSPSHSTPVSRACRLDRAEDVAALGLPGDRPDQPGVRGRAGRRRRPEPWPRAPCRGRAPSTGRRSRRDGRWRRARCRGCRSWSGRRAAPRAASRNPGPASMVTISIPGLPSCLAMRSSIDPWLACLCRLDAASVTASASWSVRAAGNCKPAGQRQRRRRGRRRPRSGPRPAASAGLPGPGRQATGSP